ncbi:hypothetical protein FRB96_003132 [Tulasnella sp. 330]|nr:hypothetical protein FRB96_003132 [Tulasnella sp. 330]
MAKLFFSGLPSPIFRCPTSYYTRQQPRLITARFSLSPKLFYYAQDTRLRPAIWKFRSTEAEPSRVPSICTRQATASIWMRSRAVRLIQNKTTSASSTRSKLSATALPAYSSSARSSYPRRLPHNLRGTKQQRTVESPHAITLPDLVADRARIIVKTGEEREGDNPSAEQAPIQSDGGSPPDPSHEDDAATARKARIRRPRSSAAEKEKEVLEAAAVQLPPLPVFSEDLIKQVIWSPEWDEELPMSSSSVLPPKPVIEDVYHKLLVTLHPHSQDRGCPQNGAAPDRPLVEPTLGLYCPVEGANYVIDAMVLELARRAQADVIMIDAAQLAAGEHGMFGEAASAFKESPNPLHLPPRDLIEPGAISPSNEADQENSEGQQYQVMALPMAFSMPSVHVMSPGSDTLRPTRVSHLSKEALIKLRMRQFFDTLIHGRNTETDPSASTSRARPRMIYLRDFDFLAASTPKWYPQLLSSVREWRQGETSSGNGHMINPTTIVLGVTPEIRRFPTQTASTPSLARLAVSAKPAERDQGARPGETSNDEDEGAKAREKEVKAFLTRWQLRGDSAVQEEMPWFSSSSTDEKPSFPFAGNGVRVAGLPDALMPKISHFLKGVGGFGPFGGSPQQSEVAKEEDDIYFRVGAIVPSARDLGMEATERMGRRRELNSLAFRTLLSEIGGTLPSEPLTSAAHLTRPTTAEEPEPAIIDSSQELSDIATLKEDDNIVKRIMLGEWEKTLIDKEVLVDVATRGIILSGNQGSIADLEPAASAQGETSSSNHHERSTEVGWETVGLAWHARKQSEYLRKKRIIYPSGAKQIALPLPTDTPDHVRESDELIERVKADKTLDPHEKRLLGCIVDTGAMPTTFASVHLPVRTIDAVRTMVSLPLLYPAAFDSGILKTHSMTGALLLGPPGVGKTLLARAVARESGARMLVVKPSDVMDMYVGEGEKLVRSVFSLARRLSPCVIFLDELDALFASRVSSKESGGAMAHRSVITEFMQEMDGLKTNRSQGNVIVIGATNRPFDLDDAVLRRLPRRLLVDLPGEKERLEILKIMLKDESIAPEVDLAAIAKRTEMFSGSDLKHVCVSAALDAIKETVDLPWMTPSRAAEQPKATDKALDVPSIESSSHPTSPSQTQQAEGSIASAPLGKAEEPITTLVDPLTVESAPLPQSRVLHQRHFDKALSEIMPSTSESLGTLSELRKWNDEFGEGRALNKGKKQGWGSRFGFGGKEGRGADGRVMPMPEERT